jgi:hypothetical protein
MAAPLGIVGFALSAYAVWIGWKIYETAGIPTNPDLIVAQYLVPGSILISGLLIMAVAEAVSLLGDIRDKIH